MCIHDVLTLPHDVFKDTHIPPVGRGAGAGDLLGNDPLLCERGPAGGVQAQVGEDPTGSEAHLSTLRVQQGHQELVDCRGEGWEMRHCVCVCDLLWV